MCPLAAAAAAAEPESEVVTAHRPPPSLAALTPLLVPLIVNHKDVGEIGVEVDLTGAGHVDGPHLLSLIGGLVDAQTRTTLIKAVGSRSMVAFDDVSMKGLRITYDPAALELHVDIDRDALAVEHMSLLGREAPDLKAMQQPAHTSGALAVSLNQVYTRSNGHFVRAPAVADLDGFVTIGGFNGVTARFGGIWTQDAHGPKWQRSPTYLTHDFFNSATRVTAGEFTPAVTGFQGSAQMLGISVSRDYSDIRPFENVHPSGRSALTLDKPSTVIVVVNGVETRRLRLQPGRYDFSDFGAPYGASTVQLIVEDIAGRREVTQLSLFNAQTLLANGVNEFGFSAGQRQSARPGIYAGPMVLSGYFRRGLSNTLTLGGGGQAAGKNWLVSSEATLGSPVGIVGVSSVLTRYAGQPGSANSFDYRQELRLPHGDALVLTVSGQNHSAHYQTPLDLTTTAIDERWRVDGRAEWRRAMMTIALDLHTAHYRRTPTDRGVDLTLNWGGRVVSTALTAGIDSTQTGRMGTFVSLNLNIPLGARSAVSARYDTKTDHLRSIEVSRYPLEQVNDISGRLAVTQDRGHSTFAGEADYTGNRLIAEFEQNQAYSRPGSDDDAKSYESSLRLSTGLAFADGAFAIGRPATRGFIIMPVHDSLQGADVTIHDEAGRVLAKGGWLGPAVAPLNTSYIQHTYPYDVSKTPDGYDLGNTAPAIFPGAASGYRIQVGSAYWKMALGYLIDAKGPVTEHAAEVISETDKHFTPQAIFTNATGRFAVLGLAPGTYAIRIDTTIVARFTVPKDKKGLVNVGQLHIALP